jgi:hypothetical protein
VHHDQSRVFRLGHLSGFRSGANTWEESLLSLIRSAGRGRGDHPLGLKRLVVEEAIEPCIELVNQALGKKIFNTKHVQ